MSLIGQAKEEMRQEFKALIPTLVRQEVRKELERLGIDTSQATGGAKKAAATPTTSSRSKKAQEEPGASQGKSDDTSGDTVDF